MLHHFSADCDLHQVAPEEEEGGGSEETRRRFLQRVRQSNFGTEMSEHKISTPASRVAQMLLRQPTDRLIVIKRSRCQESHVIYAT